MQDKYLFPAKKPPKNLQEIECFDMQDSKPGSSVYKFILKLLNYTSAI